MDNTRGTVVLCGWLGCQERYLRSYVNFWRSEGWDPITVLMPTKAAMLPKAADRQCRLTVDALEQKFDAQVEAGQNPQLVFHTFSQAGWASYANMLGWIVRRNSGLHARIAAAIIDSAPYAEITSEVYARGMYAALRPRSTQEPNKATVAALQMVYKVAKQTVLARGVAYLKDLGRVVEEFATFPQLYVYSASDPLVAAEAVIAVWREQMARGRQVLTRMFPDSDHVKHFKKYNAEYIAALHELLALPSGASTLPNQAPVEALIRQPSVVVQLTVGGDPGDAKSGKPTPQASAVAATLLECLAEVEAQPEFEELGYPDLAMRKRPSVYRAPFDWSVAELDEVEALLAAAAFV